MASATKSIVDTLNDAAESFYRKFGFTLMPPASKRAMYLLIKDAEATVATLAR